ncbi:hypothetical protein DPMN_111980 [Dreissena polymorpha]|uniref:Uncharacterized protein n=1 Tax=Dreissena polymorpha TaxID=45954 RepID=A0A9D4KFZ1_DREPO|nr:hypothetical protein DPMN_111980 [Dreissena polymorpha]
MARQKRTRAPQVEIDRIVIREVQYQLEVNRCRNEEIIVKGNFGWAWPMWAGRPRVGNGALHRNYIKGNFGWAWPMWAGAPWLVMGPCIVEINRIVIREVQNEEAIVKGNFGWAWPTWAVRLRIDHIVIRECRNEEIIVKGNFGWAWPMWAGRPRVGNGPCIAEIDRIVIREVQYQFEVNRCRNEEIIVKSNFRWAWPMWAWPMLTWPMWGGGGRPRIDRIVITEVQYQFEVNQCRNEEIIVKGNFGWAWPMWAGRPRVGNGPCIVEIDRIVIREVQYQYEDNQCRNEEIIFQGSSANITDGRTAEITTISPRFLKSAGRPRIDRIVIRDVQFQFEVNRCINEEIILKGNFEWAWLMWPGRPRVGNGAMHKVQYQFEVNRCRNEEIIVKCNFGWAWPMWAGAPGLVMGPCIVEINCIVIREVQYQFEVNRCRNEEIIVKSNFRWAWPMWAWPMLTWPMWGGGGRLRIDRIVITEVQYQFEVNRFRNEEIWPMWPWRPRVDNGPCIVEIDRIVMREAHPAPTPITFYPGFQGSSANSVGGAGGQDGRMDRQTHIITISPFFLRKTWG